YFPQFHVDPRNERRHGKGWTEWELLRHAPPRFPGHRQPVIPAWGYFDEADPTWAARQIDLAANHGVTTFLFDWYWYSGRPYLEGALERGFLQAPDRARMKFALMWANHDWYNLFPVRYTNHPELLECGKVSPAEFEQVTDYLLTHYLHQPNYLKIDGAPFFSIYELGTFIAGMRSVETAAEALEKFQEKARRAGLPGIHLNVILWGTLILPGQVVVEDVPSVIKQLGFASIGSYTWIHHYPPGQHSFPRDDYARAAATNYRFWEEQPARFPIPYFPNVTMGWDSSPRTVQSDIYEPRGYPWTAILEGNSPAAFQEALQQARAFLDRHPHFPRLLSINAWNEWTEGSYLLPDTVNGTAYLEAIRTVFGAPV
ncbi:MAG: glycoside hydrolase family 99-like domain-containing protein, partial [Ktedonobacteraceae bacterium]|nr:glycoside hydrolase family 99-like domain-containing protein [Ktedonobacteraceae bacterium]